MAEVLASYVTGHWVASSSGGMDVRSAVDGRVVALASSLGVDFRAVVAHARAIGGPGLRKLTFHQRADLLKRLSTFLSDQKEALYQLSFDTGATRKDSWIDIDGGIGTLFAFASRGRRELPSERFLIEGAPENLSKAGSFVGGHILTPLQGVAVHINAYNFPCWGLLEKLAPAILAGVPVISKPATASAYVAQALVRLIVQSGILPPGSLQLIVGHTGDLLDHLTGQDVLSFTGSLATSERLRNHPAVSRNAVRFIAERDSLNAAILAPDAVEGTPEFDLCVKEAAREMTVKAGQKCTAIRRIMVPQAQVGAFVAALSARLGRVVVGDPRREDVTMGALVSLEQRQSVRDEVTRLQSESRLVFGDPATCDVAGGDAQRGAFLSPLLLLCVDPGAARLVHEVEAFGPVSTVIPYESIDHAIELTQRGGGSLVASAYTYDDDTAEALTFGIASFHGRLLLLDRDCARESTGHGAPLPGLVHGGPGRAGGGEELGGMRGVHHYMQRTALQSSPRRMARLTGNWDKGAPEIAPATHPFRLDYDALQIGHTIHTDERAITLADIEHFAHFTGDLFYAHMDEAAAKANPFFPGRVAHGYLILSFAAGLFVDPAPGPLLANYGLDNLRFLKPVSPEDRIKVRLTVKHKALARKPDYGEVRWDAEVSNQNGETVARYELLTMSARRV